MFHMLSINLISHAHQLNKHSPTLMSSDTVTRQSHPQLSRVSSEFDSYPWIKSIYSSIMYMPSYLLTVHGMGTHSRTATVKILQHLFAAEVGVTVTMAACGKNASVVKKGALWDNTSTSRRALKVK